MNWFEKLTGFAEDGYSEVAAARQTADHFGVAHSDREVTGDLVNDLPRIVWHADEPIAEVDTENAELILDAMWEVIRRGGAVLAATHNPEALRYSNRVVLFRDGVVEDALPVVSITHAMVDRSRAGPLSFVVTTTTGA